MPTWEGLTTDAEGREWELRIHVDYADDEFVFLQRRRHDERSTWEHVITLTKAPD